MHVPRSVYISSRVLIERDEQRTELGRFRSDVFMGREHEAGPEVPEEE